MNEFVGRFEFFFLYISLSDYENVCMLARAQNNDFSVSFSVSSTSQSSTLTCLWSVNFDYYRPILTLLFQLKIIFHSESAAKLQMSRVINFSK